jgi:predicted nucleic acid-binding protein
VLLVDSSAWVILESGRSTGALRRMANYDEIAVCPAVISEVLRGTRDSRQYQRVRDALLSTVVLDSDVPLVRFEEAAQLYVRCREAGFTVRNSFDCLIAATALAFDATLLHRDSDFEYIARVMPLRLQRV